MQFLNIPANYNFLQSLYFYIKSVFKNNLEMSNVMILLPSRYSSNELKRVFLENSKENTTILPIIKAIGDIDYDDLILGNLNFDILNSNTNLIKTISNTKYKLLLIREILKYQPNININKAINLSMDLELFLNEVRKNDLSLDNLDNIVDDEYSIHWQKVLDFIKIFGKKWEDFLVENNIISNNSHALQIINTYRTIFEKNPPKHPIIVVGNFLSVKSTMNLVKTLEKYDNTYFIFKGFENNLTKEEFCELKENYSHFYFKNITKELNINCEQIKNIEFENCKVVENNIVYALNNAMLPADLTYKWQKDDKIKLLDNIKYIECDNTYNELNLISFYIIDFFKKNGLKNVAIITNKDYSENIENFLKKWDLPINNNFGINFMSNDFVKYLFIVVDVYKNDFAPEFFLSLLKNDYTRFNYTKEGLKELTELFEIYVLNNNINNNFNSYIKNIKKIKDDEIRIKLDNFIKNIKTFFEDFDKKNNLSFEKLLELHLKIAEKIANSNNLQESNGENFIQSDIFYNNKNEKVVEFIRELLEQGDCFGQINLEDYIVLLSSLFAEKTYKENYTTYPAINILSTEESRLVNYDLVIIPNLNDGSFPTSTATDPYMSKSMRLKFGLPAKEVEIGKYCYDFIQLLAQKNVLLTRAKKANNAITFKSRFLQKLEIYLKCNNIHLDNGKNIVDMYKLYIDIPYNNKYNIYKVAPNPKPEEKLVKLSATNIELLNKNPYEIYVKKFLKLYKLNIIDKQDTNALIGTVIHRVFELYCNNYNKYKNNLTGVVKLIEDILGEYDDKLIMELYFDKIVSIVQDFIEMDKKARVAGYSVFSEVENELFFPKQNFTLTARIDRIESLNNNIRIIDYKTGGNIAKTAVINGEKLQLLIEALILKKLKNVKIENLQYWMTKYKKNKEIIIDDKVCNLIELMDKAEKLVLKLLYVFNDEKCGYFATLKNKEYSDYNLLARVDEWGVE